MGGAPVWPAAGDGMSARTIFTLAGLTLLSIFLLTVLWKFVLEDIIGQLFSSDYEKESLQTHWEYVITGTSLAAIALIIPTLALLRSIAERKRAEELLKIAIDSMPEGFACYDADDRLAVVNSKMAKLYPLIADVFVPGVSFEKVLRLGVERGQFGPSDGRTEEWIQERLAYHRDPKGAVEYELSDVRTVRVEEMRTPEGGIVGVRTDITDLKKIERQLREVRDDLEIRVEERTRELMQSEAWLKAVIKCSPGAIVIRNLEGRSLIANAVYSDWYAVDGDEIIGKTMVDGLPPDTFEGITAQESRGR